MVTTQGATYSNKSFSKCNSITDKHRFCFMLLSKGDLICRYFQNVGSPACYPDHVSPTSENEQFLQHELSPQSFQVLETGRPYTPHELLLKWDLYDKSVGFRFIYTQTVTTVRTVQGENSAGRLRNSFIHKRVQTALGQGIAESSKNRTKMADMSGRYRYLYFSLYYSLNIFPKTPNVTSQWNRRYKIFLKGYCL